MITSATFYTVLESAYILLEICRLKFEMDKKVGRMFIDRTLKLMKQKYPDAMKGEIPGMYF